MTFAEIGIDGIPGQTYFREFAWTPPDGVEVSQMQIYAVANGRGITATGGTAHDVLREIPRSPRRDHPDPGAHAQTPVAGRR